MSGRSFAQSFASSPKANECAELGTEELRERVEDMLSDEGDEYVFALKDENKATHIWKLPRVKIAEMLSEIDHAVTPSAHGLQT